MDVPPPRRKIKIPNLVFCTDDVVAYVAFFGYNFNGVYSLQSICSVGAEFD